MTTTNALALVPAFRRQIGVYTNGSNTNDSALAGYIADSVQALMLRWNRTYSINFTSPQTYNIEPSIEQSDIRPVILMASIIYKMGSLSTVSFTDGDFSWNPGRGKSTIDVDREELLSYISDKPRLAQAISGRFNGFANIFNPESYNFLDACYFVWGQIPDYPYYP